MKLLSIPVALLYKVQYEIMNFCNFIVLLKPKHKGETTSILTKMARANVNVPKTILYKDVVLQKKNGCWLKKLAFPRTTHAL